jgi:hypothetical protein
MGHSWAIQIGPGVTWTAHGCGAKRPSPLTAEGGRHQRKLAQARELEAKLAEEYRTVRLRTRA